MTEVRKDERYYFQDRDLFLVRVKVNANSSVDCLLNDISVNGACIILDKQVFLQRDKHYTFGIWEKQADGDLKEIAIAKGKIVWYLTKEFQQKDMLYLGIEFEEKIQLPERITSLVWN